MLPLCLASGGRTTRGNGGYSSGSGRDGDGLGNTALPNTNGGRIAAPGDTHPLIGNPDLGDVCNPRARCGRPWRDLGRNRRANGQTFNTSNGTHFACDGALLLPESVDSTRLSRFSAATNRYDPLAAAPEIATDGRDFQFGGGRHFATMGVVFDKTTVAENGSHRCAYDAATNTYA